MADPPPDQVSPQGAGRPAAATRRAAVNAVASTLADVSGKVATLAFTIAAARALGPADYGAFAYALSFSALVATLPRWGFDLLLLQRGSSDPRSLPRFLSETLVWRTAIAIPVFLAAGIAGFVIRPSTDAALALLLVLAATIIDLYAEAWRAAATALEDQVGISKALVAQRFSAALLGIGALVLGLGLVGLSVAYLLATFIGFFGVLASGRRLGIRVDARAVNRRGLLRAGRLSVAMGIDTVVALALFSIDQVLLSELQGDDALGPYAATYRLIESVMFISWAVAKASFPVLSRGTAEPWRLRVGMEKAIAAIALFYVPFGVGLWIVAGPFLRLLYGEVYVGAGAPIARWLAAAPILFAVGYVGSYVLLALDRRWTIAWTSLVAAGANVGLNLVLIPRLSGVGAAIATIASYLLEGTLILVILARLIGMPRLDRQILLPVAASVLMAGPLLLLDLHVAIEVVLGGAIYVLAWLSMARAWAPDQLALIRSLLPGGRGGGAPDA